MKELVVRKAWFGLSFMFLYVVFGACSPKPDSPVSKSNEPLAPKALAIGKYRGTFLPPAGAEPLAPDSPPLEDLVGVLPPRLEVLPESKYRMLVMGMPVEGNIVQEGTQVTLVPRVVVGMKPNEVDPSLEMKLGGDPLIGKMESGNHVFILDVPELQNLRIRYEQFTPIPHVVNVENTKSAEEKRVVGDYTGRAILSQEKSKSKQQLVDEKVATGLGGNATLSLFADKRFAIALVMEMEGTWDLKGGKIVLTADTINGQSLETSSQKPENALVLIPDQSGKTLTLSNTGPGGATLQFVRK